MNENKTKAKGCGIEGCETKWLRGGLAGDPRDPKTARCPMHYHRERRNSPLAKIAEKLSDRATVRTHFNLPADVQQRLVVAAGEAGRTQSSIAAEALDSWISAREGAGSRKGS